MLVTLAVIVGFFLYPISILWFPCSKTLEIFCFRIFLFDKLARDTSYPLHYLHMLTDLNTLVDILIDFWC